MTPATRRFLLVFVVICVGFFSLVLYQIWQFNNKAAYMSWVASLTDAIWNQEEAKQIANQHDDWYFLNADEVDFVMQNVRGYDCAGFDDPKIDLHGNRINIALRKESNDRWPPIIIWSNGPDGIYRTPDDIVMAYGQAIPN